MLSIFKRKNASYSACIFCMWNKVQCAKSLNQNKYLEKPIKVSYLAPSNPFNIYWMGKCSMGEQRSTEEFFNSIVRNPIQWYRKQIKSAKRKVCELKTHKNMNIFMFHECEPTKFLMMFHVKCIQAKRKKSGRALFR